MRSALRLCSVSSWSSRAQRLRSPSAAARRWRLRSVAIDCAVATALAALAANASSSRSSSLENAGPSCSRSSASSTPWVRPRNTSGTASPPAALHPESAEAVLVEARARQLVLQALRAARAHRVAGDRVFQWHGPADQVPRQLARARGDDELACAA